MKLAIMQPYFFPYLGYWQLLAAVDRFIIYDDVNYINRGWINRNRILINGMPAYFTMPLHQASQNKRICDLSLLSEPAWRDKLLKMVDHTYRKAPHFADVLPVVKEIIYYETDNLSEYLRHQLQTIATCMGINTEWVATSRCYQNDRLSGQDRILDICKQEGASVYINPVGGQALYNLERFRDAGINLKFIVMQPLPYPQRAAGFTPYLSILDTLMEIGPGGVQHHLGAFDLIEGNGLL
jgi:hypothetical protein